MSRAIVLQDKDGETVYPVGIGSSLEAITDLFYPVGSYYETSDTSFDPNVSWSGTWVKDTTGKVTVGSGTNYTSGATGGSTSHTIASSELPTHTHTYSKSATTSGSHTLTNSELPKATWTVGHVCNLDDNYTGSGIVTHSRGGGSHTTHEGASQAVTNIQSHQYTFGGGGGHTHGITLSSTNSGNGGFANTAMSIMQPYIVVNRWHRTA